MLKKILVAGVIALTAFVGNPFNVCSATISQNQLYLGGIKIGYYYNENARNLIEQMYGKNYKVVEKNDGYEKWLYGNTVAISFLQGAVSEIEVTGNNGWTTPAGLSVSMRIDDAIRMYGNADYIKTRGSKTLCVYYDKLPIEETRSALAILYNNSDKKITKLQLITSVQAEFKHWFPRFVENILK